MTSSLTMYERVKFQRRSYICECDSRSCRNTLFLKPAEYEEFSAKGIVVSYGCAKRMKKKIIATDRLSVIAVIPA